MPAGINLAEIHSPHIGIDGLGNINLGTASGSMAEQVQKGNLPQIVGKNIPSAVAISNAVGASSNIANVTFQLQDVKGNNVAGNFEFDILLSDAATGLGLTATTASGGFAAASSGGTIIGTLTTSKAIRVQTNSSGAFILAITDTAKTGFYPVAYYSPYGQATVGTQLTTASYHS